MDIKLSAVACATLLAFGASAAHASDWSDTSISYRYGKRFGEPAIDTPIAKSIIALTHADGYKYGSNFFNLDVLKSDANDPAKDSPNGAQELYLTYNHQLSLAKTTGIKVAAGPLSDVALSTGFDLNSKNNAFAAAVRKIIVGPTAKFNAFGGWADLSLMYYKEKNNNGIVGKNVDFDAAYRIAGAWAFPIETGFIPLNFNGWFTYTGEKGKDGFGVDTKPETWGDAFLMADVGSLAGKKNTLWAGVGYEYVKNKFGTDHATTAGSNTSSVMGKVEWHF
jgi:nucleoside-specific outer membrane channel protein Tsx